jgi:hypothetical protein
MFDGMNAFFGGASVNSRSTVPYSATLVPGSQNVSATVELRRQLDEVLGPPS